MRPTSRVRRSLATEARPTERHIRCEYLTEPLLTFAGEQLHVDPKAGIARYGPRSYGKGDHPGRVRVG